MIKRVHPDLPYKGDRVVCSHSPRKGLVAGITPRGILVRWSDAPGTLSEYQSGNVAQVKNSVWRVDSDEAL